MKVQYTPSLKEMAAQGNPLARQLANYVVNKSATKAHAARFVGTGVWGVVDGNDNVIAGFDTESEANQYIIDNKVKNDSKRNGK